MRIAYLVNQYPKTSHSFIRRELQAIEEMGHSVIRFAMRSPEDAELPDPRDLEEKQKTYALLNKGAVTFFLQTIGGFCRRPIRALKALGRAWSFGRHSERGILLHIIYWAEALALASRAKQYGVEHIHAHFGTNSAVVACLISILTDVPFSFTVHGPEEFDKPAFIDLGPKVEASAFAVAISSFGRGQLMRHVRYDHWDKIKVVHCGLDAAFSDGERPTMSDTTQLVCVGRLCEQKAPLLAVEAIGKVRDAGHEVSLVLAGDGELRDAVEAKISELGLSEHVTITGWVSSDEVRRLISESRGLVLPSFAEGLPVVLMEAAVLERPSITTYIAGIPELIHPGKTGFLVPSGDVDALSESIIGLLQTPVAELIEIGKAARDLTLERHDIRSEAGKLVGHIEDYHASRSG